ncbi:MAG: hypothetical protein AB7I33_15085 [Gemmatimonadales bacterium]
MAGVVVPRLEAQAPCESSGAAGGLLARVPPFTPVRLQVSEAAVEGRLVQVRGGCAYVDGASPRVVPSADIERVWVRSHSTKTGALVGGIGGLVGGVIFGVIVGGIACEPVDGGDCTTAGVAVLSGLVGAAAGTGVGALVGSLVPRWKEVRREK